MDVLTVPICTSPATTLSCQCDRNRSASARVSEVMGRLPTRSTKALSAVSLGWRHMALLHAHALFPRTIMPICVSKYSTRIMILPVLPTRLCQPRGRSPRARRLAAVQTVAPSFGLELSSARSTQKMSFISARSFCGVGRALPLGGTGFDDTTFEIGQVMRTKLQYLLA